MHADLSESTLGKDMLPFLGAMMYPCEARNCYSHSATLRETSFQMQLLERIKPEHRDGKKHHPLWAH